MNIKLKIFGIFRDYLEDEIEITINDNSSIYNLRSYIINEVLKNDLVFLIPVLNKSIFSNNEEILSDDYIIKFNDIICLLPPFSGG